MNSSALPTAIAALYPLLHEGIGLLDVPVRPGPESEEKLLAYLALLDKWNRVYNLTAVRDIRQMVSHHLLDSLAMLPFVQDMSTLADVGSGGGLPGIPLAIARPDLAVTLIEANQKKASFLQQVKIELNLTHVSVYCGRVESCKPSKPFAAVISRAFSDLALFVQVAGHLADVGAPLLAMKGLLPDEEIAALPEDWRVARCEEIHVPGLEAQRHLIVLEKLKS